MFWKYYRGEWTEIEDPLAWKESEEWETVLSRAGYYDFPSLAFGNAYPGAQLYVKKGDAIPYLITFNLSDSVEHVYIDDIPSLMQWLRDYAPLFSLPQIADRQEELLKLFGRAFRAWHGHDYIDVCLRCDPIEYRKLQEFHQRRMEKKITKTE